VRVAALVLAVVSAMALTGCRVHLLEDGPYDFTTTRVLRDDCGVAGAFTMLDRGTLTTTGHLVKFAFTGTKPDLQGTYQSAPWMSSDAEALIMDGSITNTHVTLRGRDCLLDTLTVHMQAQAIDDAHFTGTASVTFESKAFPECNCKYWYGFSAARAP
jgi:hypothetical protein